MTIEDVICETPQTDYKMRQTAMRVLRALSNHQSQPLKTGGVPIDGKGVLPVAYTHTILPDLFIGVILGYDNPAYFYDEGIIAIPFEYGQKFQNIDFRTAAQRAKAVLPKTIRDLLGYIKTKAGVSMFIHEFTHYWDGKRAGEGYSSSTEYNREIQSGKHGSAYYNDTSERNAYFNQMMSRFDKASPQFYQRPFPQWFYYVLNKTFEKDFWNYLTPQSKQRFINRAHMIWASKQPSLI